MEYTFKTFKTALNKFKYIDNWFWGRYSLNCYNGCQMGCIYCDARSSRYFLPTDFENRIILKADLANILVNQIKRTKAPPDVVNMSGTSDPYQAAEKKYKITQSVLKVLKKYNYPVHLVTKSKLIERDLELINEIGKNSWACISITITTPNEKKAKFIEKQAVSPERRLEILEEIAKYPYITTGVTMMPLIPYLTDFEDEVRELIQLIKASGGKYVLPGLSLSMNDTQGTWFLNHLKSQYPELIPKFEEIYQFDYNEKSYNGKEMASSEYFNSLSYDIDSIITKNNLLRWIPRYIPSDYRRENYLISEKLFEKSYQLRKDGKPWKNYHWVAAHMQNLQTSYFNTEKFPIEINKPVKDFIAQIIKINNISPRNKSLDEWF